MTSDFELFTGQIHITKDKTTPEALGRQINTIDGTAYFQGPVQFGNDKMFHPEQVPPFTAPIPKPEAVVMIGPLENTYSPIPLICDERIKFIKKWEVNPCGSTGIGAEKYEEKLGHPYPLVVRAGIEILGTTAQGDHITQRRRCGSGSTEIVVTKSQSAAMFIGDVDIFGYTRVRDRLSVCKKADFAEDVVVKDNAIIGGNVNAGGDIVAAGEVMSQCGGHVLSAKKNFDIPHPSKKGWRLTHSCIEGPEAAVYFRGRITNSTEINLPSYWKDLVDIQSITVSLTPIGTHQDVIIKRWDVKKIYLQSKSGIPIDCFYHIYAERKDTEKLIPEYKGTIKDYPGDNSQRSIAGYHYDQKK